MAAKKGTFGDGVATGIIGTLIVTAAIVLGIALYNAIVDDIAGRTAERVRRQGSTTTISYAPDGSYSSYSTRTDSTSPTPGTILKYCYDAGGGYVTVPKDSPCPSTHTHHYTEVP